MKSPNDLIVRCMAPGNREKTILVKRELNDWVFVNVANGFIPGAAYDYFSRGAFDYPSEITVSFVGMPVKPYPLPNYHTDGVMDMGVAQPLERYGATEALSEANPPRPHQTATKNRSKLWPKRFLTITSPRNRPRWIAYTGNIIRMSAVKAPMTREKKTSKTQYMFY